MIIYDWLQIFQSVGITKDNISFGFQFENPLPIDTDPEIEQFPTPDFIYGQETPKEVRKKMKDNV